MQKQFITLLITIVLLNFFGCDPSVYFENPQPENCKNLKKVPNSLVGTYVFNDDSSLFYITPTMMYQYVDYQYIENIKDLDSNYVLEKDSINDLKNNAKWAITKFGDSVLIKIHYMDTLFYINDNYVLRKYKGYLFVNKKHDENSWEVNKLFLRKGMLLISSVESQEDIDLLKEITQTPQDTVPPYSFKPTKKQFKEFIKRKGFSNNDTLYLLNK